MRALGTAAKAGGIALAAGLAYGLKASVEAAADFEKQLSSLGAVSNATDKQLAKLREQALKAGADTAFSANEAAVAQTELAKGGLNVAQIMKGGLTGALNLAAAGELELGEAAGFTANALNLFKLNGKQAGDVADALATAANITTGDVADFGMALTQGGGAAKAAGLAFNETVVALETLANAGVKGSDAGTSLKAALVQLAGPTETQAAVTKELGLNFFDQQGNMKDLADISEMLGEKLGGLSKEQQLAAIKTIAGTDGMRTLLALMDAGPAKIEKFTKATGKQGTAAAVAAEKQDNLAGRMEQLQGSAETLGIQIGSALIPPLSDAAQATTEFVNEVSAGTGAGGRFRDTVEGIARTIQGVALAVWPTVRAIGKLAFGMGGAVLAFTQSKVGVTALAAVLGGLTARLGILAVAWAVGKIEFFVQALKQAYIALMLLDKASRATVIGALVTVIGAVVGAVIGFAGASRSTATSVRDLTDAMREQRDAMKALRDFDLEASQRRLTYQQTTLSVKRAEEELARVRRSGTPREAKQAELSLRQARLDQKSALNALNDVEGDRINSLNDAISTSRKSVDAAKHRVDVLTLERAMLIKSGASTERLEQNQQDLSGATRTLRNEERELSGALARLGNQGHVVDPLISRFRDLGLSINNARYFAQQFKTALADINSVPRLQPLPSLPSTTTGHGRARGGKVDRPMVLVGEEAPTHEEFVIATNPAYRKRNVGFLVEAAQALGIPGFAGGKGQGTFIGKGKHRRYVPTARQSFHVPIETLEARLSDAQSAYQSAKSRPGHGPKEHAAHDALLKAQAILKQARPSQRHLRKHEELAEIQRQRMDLADSRNRQGQYDTAKRNYIGQLRQQLNVLNFMQRLGFGKGHRKGSAYWRQLEGQILSVKAALKEARSSTSQASQETTEAATPLDSLEAAMAEAGLTPGLTDDKTAADALVHYWEGQLAAARKSGDPRRIKEAADALKSARDTRASLNATTTTDAGVTTTGPTADETAQREQRDLRAYIQSRANYLNAASGYVMRGAGDLGYGGVTIISQSLVPADSRSLRTIADTVVGAIGQTQGAVTSPRQPVTA